MSSNGMRASSSTQWCIGILIADDKEFYGTRVSSSVACCIEFPKESNKDYNGKWASS
jgi:hypothetical protein